MYNWCWLGGAMREEDLRSQVRFVKGDKKARLAGGDAACTKCVLLVKFCDPEKPQLDKTMKTRPGKKYNM